MALWAPISEDKCEGYHNSAAGAFSLVAGCKADDFVCSIAGRKQGAHFRVDVPQADAGWQGKQIVHTKKGTKMRKTKGFGEMNHLQLKKLLNHFFHEDIGTGDLTSQSIFEGQNCEASIVAKSDGIFAGAAVIKEGFALLDEKVQTFLHKKMEIICERVM